MTNITREIEQDCEKNYIGYVIELYVGLWYFIKGVDRQILDYRINFYGGFVWIFM